MNKTSGLIHHSDLLFNNGILLTSLSATKTSGLDRFVVIEEYSTVIVESFKRQGRMNEIQEKCKKQHCNYGSFECFLL